MHRSVLSGIVLLASVVSATAQTSLNPDLSVIPRFRLDMNDGEKLPTQRQWNQPDLTFEELELVLQAYLNPYAKADVVLSLPGPDVEEAKLGLEEAYATILRGLPLDLNLRVGKYRVEYGKINRIHPHAWPFLTQPLSQQRFIGEEGLNDVGVSASVLLPTGDIYTQLTVDLLRGLTVAEAAGITDTSEASPYYANSARLSSFFAIDDENDLEVGMSMFTGIHDPYNRDRFWYLNADFKYKYRPSSYSSLVLQGEYLYSTRRAWQDKDLNAFLLPDGTPEHRNISTAGLYVYADFQFLKVFSIGARYDWSQTPYSAEDKATAIALFAGYYPVEETLGLRLQYQRTSAHNPLESQTINSLALQVVFSLGPHKAHPF